MRRELRLGSAVPLLQPFGSDTPNDFRSRVPVLCACVFVWWLVALALTALTQECLVAPFPPVRLEELSPPTAPHCVSLFLRRIL